MTRRPRLEDIDAVWPLLLLLLTIPAAMSLLIYGLPMTHDGITHLFRIARLDDYVRQGILFPRWMPDMLLGYGYPLFNYYAAGTYYLVEAFHLSGLGLYWSFIVVQILLVLLAASGMYLFARDLFTGFDDASFIPALVASVAYAYAPYLLINIYVRGAIAELGAQALLPWILWAYRRIWRHAEPRRYVLWAALSLGGLAWTHTISLLMVPVLLVSYSAVLASNCSQRRNRFGWWALAIAGAMGISCFYWLPLLAEQSYLTDYGYVVSKTLMLPRNFHDWRTFMDMSIQYQYSNDAPFKLGLVQVIGLLIGVPFVFRRSREWWYWVGVALVCALMMAQVARPLWFSNDILPVIQFPWRLLAIMGIPLALLIALPFAYIHNTRLRTALGIAAILALIWLNLPRLEWEYHFSPTTAFDIMKYANYEARSVRIIEGGTLHASLQEFRPKWTDDTLSLEPATVEELVTQPVDNPPVVEPDITVNSAGPLHSRLSIATPATFPLRFAAYYFPGWTVVLDDTTSLVPYPSTNLGLLTVDLPAGQHTLSVDWAGTRHARWAGLISQLALLTLLLWQLAQPSPQRWWGLALLPLFAISLFAGYTPSPQDPVQPAPAGDQLPGVQFLGWRGPQLTEDGIQIFPYWYATETSPPPFAVRWQLRNQAGETVAQIESGPFYDSTRTENWPGHTIMDDGYLLPTPPDLPAGTYDLVMTALDQATGAATFSQSLGTVTLARTAGPAQPEYPLEIDLGDRIVLTGYDFAVNERLFLPIPHLDARPDIQIANTGETLDYMLYWRTRAETNDPYIGFIHLTDHLGRAIAHEDQLPGPLFMPVSVWTNYGTYTDQYRLRIPTDAESGLYWPNVGMYDFRDQHRFAVKKPGAATLDDHFELPPVKIVNRAIQPAGVATGAHFGDLAEMVRFRIEDESGRNTDMDNITVQPGSTITLTTYYQVEQPSAVPLSEFVQLRDAAGQILAQHDGEPQGGHNPTWAWLSGEVVRDRVQLTIPDDVPTGTFHLYLGFYDAAANYQRLSVTDEKGNRLANDELPLGPSIIVQPADAQVD